MPPLKTVAAALLVLAVATPGCSRNRNVPTQLAPSRMTAIGVNAYLWRAALDTVSFAPLLQADANTGVITVEQYLSLDHPDSSDPNDPLGLGDATVGATSGSSSMKGRMAASRAAAATSSWLAPSRP